LNGLPGVVCASGIAFERAILLELDADSAQPWSLDAAVRLLLNAENLIA